MTINELFLNQYVIVRTYSAGVFAGTLIKKEGNEVEMHNARRLWYWDGAASLSQLAEEGVKKPENCKFPQEVEQVILLGVVEILKVSEAAKKSIDGVEIWKQ
jgi:5-formaminoimidazole-4-carboxamide-1-beta-D-ribofuranosyl 5'-monophosphate synthetase